VEAERAAIEAAERVRTLYVAMTRAKERLVLAGIWQAKDEIPPEQARSHADLLLARRDRPEIGGLWDAAAGGGGWAVEEGGALWVFPALDPVRAGSEREEAPRDRTELPLPSSSEVARGVAELASRRAAAASRMARPFAGAASEEAHARLAELAAERSFGEGDEGTAGAGSARSTALAAGSAVHRALESWDFAAPVAAELARQSARLPAYLAALVDGGVEDPALARARHVLARFAAGPFPGRLAALAGGIVARELPVLLPPGVGSEGDEGARSVGFVAGVIDLLYRERGTEGFVVADYKTDEVAGEGELAARAAAYAPQGAIYRRAVAEALGLARPPRFELWFLAAGRIVEA